MSGKAFIAENKIWSARHIFEKSGYDLINLGDSTISGLSFCKEDHIRSDVFFFTTKLGDIYMYCILESEDTYNTMNTAPVIGGDSGSPVFCMSHTKVIGIVSARFPLTIISNATEGFGCIITKITPDFKE